MPSQSQRKRKSKMDVATVKEDLKNFFTGAKRIAIVGIGQSYRQDDAVGVIIVEKLFLKLSGGDLPPLSLYEKEFTFKNSKVRLFLGYETPENLTSKLRKFFPTHVVFVDAAQLAREAGEIELVPISEIKGEEISTHNLPLSILGKYLEMDMGSQVVLLGIQPLSIELGPEKSLSVPVTKAAESASQLLEDVLGNLL